METIRIKYLSGIDHIQKIHKGDWIDLRCAEDTELKAGEYKLIPLGVAMELPRGYEALCAPRSSTFKNYGILLANSMGIIDETYKGDNDQWHFPAYATRDVTIPKNERICQFRIIEHQPEVEFEEVKSLGNLDRGGIGSTGKEYFEEDERLSVAGQKYEVIKKSTHFYVGETVVALENDTDIPFCISERLYKEGKNRTDDYMSNDYWAIMMDNLEEV